jgi:hypothetical protein
MLVHSCAWDENSIHSPQIAALQSFKGYKTWEAEIIAEVSSTPWMDILTGALKCPSPVEEKAMLAWKKGDRILKSLIVNSISRDIQLAMKIQPNWTSNKTFRESMLTCNRKKSSFTLQ